MAGEISPDITFCKKTKKYVRNTPNGCVWVRMGAGRCIDTEGIKNKTKRRSNGRAAHVFQCMFKDRKKQELGNGGNGWREASWGRIMGQ